MISKLVGY